MSTEKAQKIEKQDSFAGAIDGPPGCVMDSTPELTPDGCHDMNHDIMQYLKHICVFGATCSMISSLKKY